MKGLFSHMQKKPLLFLRNIGIYLVLQYNQECTLISKNLIPQHGLQQQDEPFTTEEIDAVIKHMPTYKVLGPDGFDGIFIKNAGISLGRIFTIYVRSFTMALLIFSFLIMLS
jgi:hypothetical protein